MILLGLLPAILLVLAVVLHFLILNPDKKYIMVEKIPTTHCDLHDWHQVKLITKDNYKELAVNKFQDLDKVEAEHYCLNCGFIPNREAYLKPKYLKMLQDMEVKHKADLERLEDIKYLRDLVLKEYMQTQKRATGQDLTEWEKMLVTTGFNLYDDFVGKLPDLLKQRQVDRLIDQLK